MACKRCNCAMTCESEQAGDGYCPNCARKMQEQESDARAKHEGDGNPDEETRMIPGTPE